MAEGNTCLPAHYGPQEQPVSRRRVAMQAYFTGGMLGELLRSEDGGATWASVYQNPDGSELLTFGQAANGDLIMPLTNAVGELLICKSTDAGVTWETVLNMGADYSDPRCLTRLSDDTLLLSVYGPVNYELWRSSDDGANWSLLASSGGGGNYREAYVLLEADNGDLLIGKYDIRRSQDGGVTWAVVRADSADETFFYGCAKGANGYLWLSIGGSSPTKPTVILRSVDNGANWTTAYSALQRSMYGLWVTATGRALADCHSTGDVKLRYSDDDGVTWNPFATNATGFIMFDASGANVLGIGYWEPWIMRSLDNGATWTAVGQPTDGGDILYWIRGPFTI